MGLFGGKPLKQTKLRSAYDPERYRIAPFDPGAAGRYDAGFMKGLYRTMGKSAGINTLRDNERERFAHLKDIVKNGLAKFQEVGEALLEIRDSRLYRETHHTFEAFCRDEWGMTHRHANRLIEASNVMINLGPIGPNQEILPKNEAQARELAALPQEAQALAWKAILSTAPENGPTAAHIKSVAIVFDEMLKTGAIEYKEGEQLALSEVLTTAVTEETRERLERRESHLFEARVENRIRRLDTIRIASNLSDLKKLYPIVYADPPWRYEHSKTHSRDIENQYPTMSLDEICALPVADITPDSAILFLWATAPKLEEAMQVIRAWDFTYRTCMVWDKESMGMGYWTRVQHELLLIAVKGDFPVPEEENRVRSVYREKREEHSAKPDYYRDLIERMYPDMSRIELFARKSDRESWDVWGNEVEQLQ